MLDRNEYLQLKQEFGPELQKAPNEFLEKMILFLSIELASRRSPEENHYRRKWLDYESGRFMHKPEFV